MQHAGDASWCSTEENRENCYVINKNKSKQKIKGTVVENLTEF